MKRYPAFDPPEYLDWQPDEEVMRAYQDTVNVDSARRALIEELDETARLAIYEGLLRNRLHDIALKRWVKQGVISKAWLGTGEEAVTIGGVHALDRRPFKDGYRTDFVAPMIRNAGACHEMGMNLADMFRGYLATQDSPTGGRDLHIGSIEDGVIAPISHVGDIVAVCNGIAMKFKMCREPRVVITWAGDGTTKTGVFHEAVNFAASQHLPVIIVIQNNQVALGTRLEQHHCGEFSHWAASYGMWGITFDGNNVLDCYAATRIAATRARNGEGPALLVGETFRMGGHATHDEVEGRKILSADLFTYWGKRDPIGCYETYLIEGDKDLAGDGRSKTGPELKASNQAVLEAIEGRVMEAVERAAELALMSKRECMPKPESALEGVYAPGIVDALV